MVNKASIRYRWAVRYHVRALVREVWWWMLRRRDEQAIRSALHREDWDGYARARMEFWRRWEVRRG